MARQPKPWYRKDRDAWFVTINGTRHNLGSDKKKARSRFHALMREPSTAKVASQLFAAIADAFLDWVQANRAPRTFEWYQYRLERFCQRYPDLAAGDLRPFHVQQWVDSYKFRSKTTRRNYIRTIKRCAKWARQQGYLAENPIQDLEVPGADAREVVLTKADFDTMLANIPDPNLRELCTVAYDIGCRPQEILRLEARHLDIPNHRWVIPAKEAKGKQAPRIVYLTPAALETSMRLAKQHPTGPIFRNQQGIGWTVSAVNCGFKRLQHRMGTAELKRQGKSLKDAMQALLKQEEGPKHRKLADLSERERYRLARRVTSRLAPKYCLYALRHSWATRALQSGLDALTVAVLMGHKDPSTLSRVYQHLSHNPEHLRMQAQRAVAG